MTASNTFAERMDVGIRHEDNVAKRLAVTGNTVEQWGLPSFAHQALKSQTPPAFARWLPDFLMTTRASAVYAVDAKSVDSNTPNWAIETSALHTYHLLWSLGIRTIIVFPDWTWAFADELRMQSRGSGTPFHLFPKGNQRPWEQIP